MFVWVLPILFLSSLTLGNGNTLQETLNIKRLQSILEENVKSNDIASIYYSVRGLKQLNANISNLCETLKKVNYDVKSIEQVYFLTNAAALTNCLNSLSPDVLSTASKTLDKKDVTIPELYYAVYSLKALGKGTIYDKEEGLKNVIQLLKKDDTPANYGLVFSLCEHMGCKEWTIQHAESVLQAADESDSRALFFDGGLPVTSLLLSTILRAFKSANKASPLTEQQRYKFAQYLVSRRSVNTPRGAALLLEAAFAIADEDPTPIAISIKGKKHISSESDSITVSVSDLVGRAVRGLRPDDVVAQSGTRLADDVVVLSKQPLAQAQDPTLFVLNLSKIKSQYGVYKVALTAGGAAATVGVSVLGSLGVARAELGVGDVDGTTAPRLATLHYPHMLPEPLAPDFAQKVSIKWTVTDKAGRAVLVQQAFVRVASADREAIFVAEPDSNKAYKVELKASEVWAHVGAARGLTVTLLLGSAAAARPLAWPLAELTLALPPHTVAPPAAAPSAPAPELWHQFRSAEARPARAVSDVFAAAAAAPLLLLLLLWARLHVPLRLAPLLPALAFHLSLAGCLTLYAVLWLRLSMFETARYLLPLALLTFLSGHRLLRRLASDKQR